jgi:eukaryotic-like serine/threonine-protein kinase
VPERYLGSSLGKYRVDSLLGSGGFAWVYKAFDPELEIPVALKVLKPQFGGDADFVTRFKREAAVAAKLRHPNIIKIYTIGREGDAVFFAMDFLPSGLADKLETMPFLAEDAVIQIGMDVARALGFAHREGVIHRDIKVDNIMFDEHGNAVVADFGIARALTGYTNQTGTGMVVGTPQYFAPEQARAKPLDGRADIYSLGVTLYRASTGRLPFVGDDWYEVARQHVEDVPTPPRELNPAISEAFESVLMRCLAKRPDDRPSTGEQLLDELELVRTGGRVANPQGRTLSVPALGDTAVVPATGLKTPATPVPERPASTTSVQRREQRTVWITGGLLLALVVAAVPLLARRTTAGAGVIPADSLPTAAGIVVNAVPPSDTAGDSSVALAPGTPASAANRPGDTTARPANAGRLTIITPGEATVALDGIPVTAGRWQSDTIRAGEHTVVVTIPAIEGCESASISRAVRVRAGANREENIAPRPCGRLTIDGRGSRGQFVVAASDGGWRREGTVPIAAPLILPVGRYRISVTKHPEVTGYCAPYEAEFEIKADVTERQTFQLLCGPS